MDAPRERPLPRFSRGPYVPSAPPPLEELAPEPKKKKSHFKPATVPQALIGSAIAGACAFSLGHFVYDAATYLKSNPVVRNAPLGLTDDLNYLLTITVTMFGGLAVLMFAFNGVGLLILSLHLLQKQAGPAQELTAEGEASSKQGEST